MFNLFKKKSQINLQTVLPIDTDLHSHVLPGLDDGAADMEKSLELIRGMHELGIEHIIATPHIIGDMYRNNAEIIGKALAQVQEACSSNNIPVKISAAAEYMLDDYFLELLRSGKPLLTIKDNLLLTEMPYTSSPDDLDEICFEIITAGYQPIMAHPERYGYYHKNYKAFDHLKEIGFLLQVNLLSIPGYYGSAVSKAAMHLLEKDLTDLVASDLHHTRHLQSIKNSLAKIGAAVGNKSIMNLRGKAF